MPKSSEPPPILAAGVLPWRISDHGLEVALVHRPRYDDWSWPKGKLDPGEDYAATAAREALEETGLQVRLGPRLPDSDYEVERNSHGLTPKHVRYWAASVVHDTEALEHEVDEVRWLSPTEARLLLTYDHDTAQLTALEEAYAAGDLDVWPLLIVRHARAVPRKKWNKTDAKRPLDKVGMRRAKRMVGLIRAYLPTYVCSSPSRRCADTFKPYSTAYEHKIRHAKALSEEAYERSPGHARQVLADILERGEATALCTHGPLLPDIVSQLAGRAEEGGDQILQDLAKGNLDKGEILVCQIAGTGSDASVRSLSRLRPGTELRT